MSLSEPMSLVNSYSCTVGLRGFLLTHILIRLHPVRPIRVLPCHSCW
jgi:hypothetical protein